MKFFIDERISPSLSRQLSETGLHDAIHPRDRQRSDHRHRDAEDLFLAADKAAEEIEQVLDAAPTRRPEGPPVRLPGGKENVVLRSLEICSPKGYISFVPGGLPQE